MSALPHADFESHRIEGFARAALEAGRDGAFSVPLISHVEGNLWTGGCINGVALPDDFDYVVSLYPWEKYKIAPRTTRVESKLYDSGDTPDARTIYDLANTARAFMRTGKTLVHCQAGLNRSGLVAGLALVLEGMDPPRALALMREKRCPVVLCNETFERYLLEYERP